MAEMKERYRRKSHTVTSVLIKVLMIGYVLVFALTQLSGQTSSSFTGVVSVNSYISGADHFQDNQIGDEEREDKINQP